VLVVVCKVMLRMMSHGHSGHDRSTHDGRTGPERKLADRLASGEIDVDEYERLLEVLRRPDGAPSATRVPDVSPAGSSGRRRRASQARSR
jgi:hypothetical protein